jgi:HEAT repeat protein
MGISLEQQEGEWYNSHPYSGGIYDLINTAAYGAGQAERLRAVVALGKSGDPRAVRPLTDLLADEENEIRLAATTALGSLRSGRAVDELIERLRDPGEQTITREQAAVALAAIRSTGALRGLREFVADDAVDPALRTYTGNLIRDLGAL